MGVLDLATTNYRYPLLVAAALAVGACTESDGNDAGAAPISQPRKEAVVLLAAEWGGAWPAGLDPATNTTARPDATQMNAIFGGLFQLVATPGGVAIKGVLAEG